MGRPLNIWLVQTGEVLPLDRTARLMRTGMIADMLAERGHAVLWWTSSFDHFSKSWHPHADERVDVGKNLSLFFLKGTGYRGNKSIERFRDHRIVAAKFARFSRLQPRPDIIVASLPPHDIAGAAARFAEDSGVPLIVDVRDPWPDVFIEQFPPPVRAVARLILNREYRIAAGAIRRADAVFSVNQRLLRWALSLAGRAAKADDAVFPLGAKPLSRAARPDIGEQIASVPGSTDKAWIVLYAGTISRPYHDPSVLLDAARAMRNVSGIRFIIAGDGALLSELRKRAGDLHNVLFTGWMNQDELAVLYRAARIGVCPSQTELEIPTNKMYAYLSAGLPVLTSFGGETRRILEERRAGFFFPPNAADALVRIISRLHDDEELLKTTSRRAKKLFEEQYSADTIYGRFADVIEKIAGCRS